MKQTVLNRLTNQFHALDHLLHSLTEAQMRQPGKWSIFENLAHLGRYQEVFSERLQRINAEKNPLFGRYVADEHPHLSSGLGISFPELWEHLSIGRARLNAFVSLLHEEQLIRIGLHPAYGAMTIEGCTEFFLLHEAHHFFTILKLGGSLRTGEYPIGL